MEQQETTMVECILRITNQQANFNKDIKVNLNWDLLDGDSWGFEDICFGASQTLLQKYLPQMRIYDTVISLLRPIDLSREDFVEFLENVDISKAKADIDAILASLPKDKRAKVLQSFITK